MLTLLKAALIVTVVGVCGCNKRKNITSPARLQRDVLDDYDIQAQSLFGPLPSAYNQPTRNRDPFGNGVFPSRGHGQLNNYGRQYGNRPFPWGGQIQQSRNTDYRLHDESEESRGRFPRPQVLPSQNYWRPTPNYGGTIRPLPLRYTDYRLHDESEEARGRFPRPQVFPSMPPGQYRPQQQNSQWPQPIAPYYYSALPLKGSSIIQSHDD